MAITIIFGASKLNDLSTLKNYFKLSGATLVKDDTKNLTGAKVYVSSKYLESTKDYLAYTFAISGLNKVHDGHNLAEEAIVFLPYTIYDKGDGVYGVEFGEPISQSYTTVNEIYNFVKPAQQ